MKIKVEESPERLDKYLSKKIDYSRSKISKMLDTGYIMVNNRQEKASYKVQDRKSVV